MGFYIAFADGTGSMLSTSQTQLSPGPARVEYPTEPLGQLVETADGRVIQQQPTLDNRRRTWVWLDYPEDLSGNRYRTLWNLLQSLRSRYRKLYGAATPYIYVKDDTTQELRRQVTVTGTSTGSNTTTTLKDTGKAWTVNAYAGYQVEIVSGTGAGQFRNVVSNTSTALTIDSAWSVTPDATSVYAVHGWINDWFKARVVEVSRKVADGGNLRMSETRFTFVIEDSNWNYQG